MMKQILCSMLIVMFFVSCENRYRKGGAYKQDTSSKDHQYVGKTSDDAYQVSQNEYDDNFVSRYGLLYLKASEDPFTGRILTVDLGESGEFVSSDESWKDGRKHGKSSKWFSNGIKMYERNYREGRWHGSVTRWWPNGQKMYVRAYSNGVRHGKEATWRSDGTALSIPAKGAAVDVISGDNSQIVEEELPSVDISGQSFGNEAAVDDSSGIDLSTPPTLEEPDTDDLVLPATDEEMNDSDAAFTDLPSFPPLTEETSSPVESSEGLPSIPENNDLPIELPSDPLPLPPSSDEEAASLPELPGFDQAEESMNNENLPLPSLPDDSDAGGLPALPGIEEDGGLPPLPGDDSGLGDLPPLPPLP